MIKPLEALIATGLRARTLSRPLTFIARETSRSHAIRPYSLRQAGIWMCLQHNTPDVLVLDEIFYQRLYELPAELERLRSKPLRVLDGGANIGLFGVWVLATHPGSEVVSFEPDSRNARLLRSAIARNEAQHSWRMVEAALATASGRVTFAGADFATSHVVEDSDGPTVAAVDFFEHAAEADLIKLDIEGSEWAILADARMSDVRAEAIVLEYHPENCPGDDSHATVTALLERAGFAIKPVFKAPTGVGMLWAWRERT